MSNIKIAVRAFEKLLLIQAPKNDPMYDMDGSYFYSEFPQLEIAADVVAPRFGMDPEILIDELYKKSFNEEHIFMERRI